jgi:hypothetical protein
MITRAIGRFHHAAPARHAWLKQKCLLGWIPGNSLTGNRPAWRLTQAYAVAI